MGYTKQGSIKKFISVAMAVLVLTAALPLNTFLAEENNLILSDCSGGWEYSGNSTLNYSAVGTEGSALEVKGAFGALRPLSYKFAQTDISSFEILEWDMVAVTENGEDILPEILEAYSDSFYFSLSDSSGKEFKYPLSYVNFVRQNNGWYHARARLSESDGIDLKNVSKITISTLSKNAFSSALPEAFFCFDTFSVSVKPLLNPEITGAQINAKNELRFIASISKIEYEALKENSSKIDYGFIVGSVEDFNSSSLELESQKDYINYVAEKLYYLNESNERLYFTVVLSHFDSNALKSEKLAVRAYVYSAENGGEGKVFYSYDGFSGGYEVSWDDIATEASFKEAENSLKGINVIPDNTPIAQVEKVQNADVTAGKPYAVNVKYDDGTGVCIAVYDVVRDFKAPVNNTAKDSSEYIQRAMNYAKELGGGTVYIPEGVYRIDKPLTVPGGVTLRGEWISPDTEPAAGKGTVLLVNTGGIEISPEPFISLKTGSCFRNITVLYPETAGGSFTEYSSTIAETPAGGSDSYNVLNVTVLGGSVGFDAATAWSELHYLKNVYFSCLKQAIRINNVTDIGRLEGIHISPDYLIQNEYIKISDDTAKAISDYMYTNADGLYIERSDWQYVYDLEISGQNRGIVFNKYIDISDNNRVRGSNGQMFEVSISNCKTAVDVLYTNAIGYALTEISISDCETGFSFSEDYLSSFEIANCSFFGKILKPLVTKSQNNGKISFTNSKFGCSGAEGYVATVYGGNLSLQQCEFTQANKHVRAESSSGAVSVLGCKFPKMPDISRSEGREEYIKVDNTPLNLPVSSYKHTYRRSIPTAASMYVYNVADYGAQDGMDSTNAFKSALSAAEKTGGTVYVPQGEYYVYEPLTVPSGVELRGIYDSPTHPVTQGSVICTDYGKNDESAQAFISLEESSGINGISFYYPEQTYSDFIPYAWTVRSLGKNCWAKNCVFINSYNGLDFGTNPSDGHYINYVSGSPLRRGIFVGNNSSNGWVENVHFNPHYWKRAKLSTLDTEGSEALNTAVNETLEAMIFGDNASEHVLATFGFAAKDLLVFVTQGKGGTNGIIIGHGSDGCRNALVAHELDCVVMLNAELVSMNYTEDMHHIVMEDTVTGTLALFNMTAWAQPLSSSIKMDGGKLLICQLFYHNLEYTTNIAEVGGGTLYMSSAMLPIKDVHFIVKGEGRIRLKANLSKNVSSTLPPAFKDTLRYSRNGGAVSQTCGWWI